MKSLQVLLAVLVISVFSAASAQTITMKIPGVTPTDGETVKALEYKIEAATSWIKGGGAAVGKPDPGALLIKKDAALSTNEFFKKIVTGTSFPEISFTYTKADSSDPKAATTYIITIYDVFVTDLQWLTPECPNCLSLEHQVGFVYKKIKMEDPVNKKMLTWDVSTGTIQ